MDLSEKSLQGLAVVALVSDWDFVGAADPQGDHQEWEEKGAGVETVA
jgi:hypothetical protein